MTKVLYFENVHTGGRYQILRRFTDADGRECVELKGPNASFVEPFNKEKFKQLGYTLKVEETEDDDE